MIERLDGRQQLVCDSCPAAQKQTYADDDFDDMIADARADGWIIRKRQPAPEKSGSADLFGCAPRTAGEKAPSPWSHACPACTDRATTRSRSPRGGRP